jgi:hypothetical protein
MRSKAVMKLIVGFSLYLILMAKNFFFEGKTETRYVDLLIVCNVLCSSFPVDLQVSLCARASPLADRD